MRPSGGILLGTLIIGTLDGLDAIVFFGLRSGASPVRIFQSIAFGLLGRRSYSGGVATAALGLAIHYFVALGIVATYFLLSRRVSLLTRRPVLCGAIYGIGVYFFMNRVVIPLSAIGPQPFVLAPFINGILIHIVGIGIPTALIAAGISYRR
jgi:uncharacterized membrane protein YagU involved in acid resistance